MALFFTTRSTKTTLYHFPGHVVPFYRKTGCFDAPTQKHNRNTHESHHGFN
jgi:hypothetical protein